MTTQQENWRIYLSGEIHTDWRDQIEAKAFTAALPVTFSAPITNHAFSDDCGVEILGAEPDKFWHDRKGAQVKLVPANSTMEPIEVPAADVQIRGVVRGLMRTY